MVVKASRVREGRDANHTKHSQVTSRQVTKNHTSHLSVRAESFPSTCQPCLVVRVGRVIRVIRVIRVTFTGKITVRSP